MFMLGKVAQEWIMSVSVLTKIEVQKVCESVGERRGLCWDSRAPSGGLLMQINLNVYWTDDFKQSLMYFKHQNSVWKSRQIEYLKYVFNRKLQIASPGRCLSTNCHRPSFTPGFVESQALNKYCRPVINLQCVIQSVRRKNVQSSMSFISTLWIYVSLHLL